MTRDLTQLNKLEQYLKDHKIPYERFDNDDIPYSPTITYAFKKSERHQICVPGYSADNREWDAICQRGSYGAEEGLLEIYGSIVPENAGDSVEGWLTANDVIERIEKVYGENETD